MQSPVKIMEINGICLVPACLSPSRNSHVLPAAVSYSYLLHVSPSPCLTGTDRYRHIRPFHRELFSGFEGMRMSEL